MFDSVKLRPLGVKVSSLDLRSEQQRADLRKLLFENGFVFLPAHSAAPGAPLLHEDQSLITLAQMFGTLETYHPVNPVVAKVHILETNVDNHPPDSFLRHSDLLWMTVPSRGTVLCAYELPPKGQGKTCFLNSHNMYERLPKELREKLQYMTIRHSVDMTYRRSNYARDFGEEPEGTHQGVHPVIVKHPDTRKPILFADENAHKNFEGSGLSPADDAKLHAEILSYAYEEELYEHDWSKYDVVIWDNYGVQHVARADYTAYRRMHRASSSIPNYRTERYFPTDKDEEKRRDNLMRFFSDPSLYEGKTAFHYDHDTEVGGYKLSSAVAKAASEHLKKLLDEAATGQKVAPRMLDVGAGTGQVALRLLQGFDLMTREWADYMDSSEIMKLEARRRLLYKDYIMQDANEDWSIEDEFYDVTVSAGAIAENMIQAEALENMIRVTKAGGILIVTVEAGYRKGNELLDSLSSTGRIKTLDSQSIAMSSVGPSKHVLYVFSVKRF